MIVPDGEFANEKVAILTRGIASVTIGTDDISGNFLPNNGFPARVPTAIFHGAFLRLPVGRVDERVDNDSFQIYAQPFTVDNEFTYEVRGTYSVTYEP
ncbi:hypothetical protein AJ87_03080 [Rhizobium yanglingense]|nr:hypothetical protein AJ87_03080 [Rhizobium yanglingense]